MSGLKIGRMVLGSCGTNTYFVYREGGEECIVIDPADRGRQICAALRKHELRTAGILLTHGHFDHIWGVEALKAAANEVAEHHGYDPVQVYACEDERELLGNARVNVSEDAGRACEIEADVYVRDGDRIDIAGMSCRVIATPGHTAGGCCYYFEEDGFCVCGDTIFQESVGRTDLPTGSMGTLVRSIQEKIFTLPEETKLYPGHGDSTTVGHEIKYNPYCG
ncbi:MAG: MBL fold metallo-hydrolase [Clostridium sp.]|nr:MBL fold metallo-hydrolase [Acetatifactor muris]MCM1527063.1 MBL fold metallo-hydrolase [Bacteroides sp.]MCM1562039.1 MBL fold metallo-hydrolase [Clostridium sp.]